MENIKKKRGRFGVPQSTRVYKSLKHPGIKERFKSLGRQKKFKEMRSYSQKRGPKGKFLEGF